MRTLTSLTILAAIGLASGTVLAVDPPGLMNYQGVLRDADDNPLDGAHDMVFRFYDDEDPAGPENEIFVDEHLASGTGAVTVTGGLFDVVLGSGNFYDGSGPGDHPHIYYVFGLHETVYLEVQVGAETLEPRMQVVSAPYAIHAAVLGGYTPSDFINTSSEEQEKIGLLRALGGVDLGNGADDDLTAFDAATLTGGPTVYADVLHNHTSVGNADTVDSKHAWEFAEAAHGHSGSDITGPVSEATNADTVDGKHASEFIDTSSTPQSKIGPLIVDAAGVSGSTGLEAVGQDIGGFFSTILGDGSANVAHGNRGIEAYGTETGGYFEDSDGTSHAYVALGGRGVQAYGDELGGYFEHSGGTSSARLAEGDTGILAVGDGQGGLFQYSAPGYAEARVAASLSGDLYGVWAASDIAGGYFQSSNLPHPANYAYLGYKDGSAGYGVKAEGSSTGGFFTGAAGSRAIVARDDFGISATSATLGGQFQTTNFDAEGRAGYRTVSGHAYGIWGQGDTAGGYFADKYDSGHAWVGSLDEGISAYGTVQGGYFERDGSGYYTHVAYGTNKVQGPGSNSFVQNHPYEQDRVLVYNSPEGDEVATYTRGTARLLGGEARVRLGETFSWVTNPDIGLTAYVTPVGEWSDLYVAEKSAVELVVRSRDGAPDVAFDYIVCGLRIGFEEVSIVQEKHLEARIPSMSDHEQRYEQHPELRAFNALERFKAMELEVRGIDSAQLDFRRSAALEAAIEEYDPVVHGRVIRPHVVDPAPDGGPGESAPRSVEAGSESPSEPGSASIGFADRPATIDEVSQLSAPAFAVSQAVEPGDLLVLDPDHPGQLRRTTVVADPNVVGIAAAEPVEVDGQRQVEMVDSLYAVVKADATYGVIHPGDLLTTSPTPGHAMFTVVPSPGTVIGKALEALESGTGSIQLLVMPR